MAQITVKRLPKDPGPAAWNAILPPAPAARPLSGPAEADFIVIGAGFAGLAAARRLTQLSPTARVVVLEARRVAEGPAGRNSGFMIDLPHDLSSDDYGGDVTSDRDTILANRAAIDFAASMAADFGLTSEAFVRSGKINAAVSARGLQHNADFGRHLSTLGEPHEFLDPVAMQQVTGIPYYRGGLVTPGCAMIQPALFVRGVAAGLQSDRLRLCEESPVTGLSREAGKWQAVTPNGTVTAPKAILAVNGHANSFGFFKGRLMHVFTYASMTRALTEQEVARLGGQRIWGLTPADPMGSTVRRISGTGGDRIVVRNRFTYDPSLEVSDARIARVARDHDRSFAARFPMLNGVEMEYRWGGRLCLSRNNVPAFGEVAEGLFSACCQNGLGTAKGTLSGMLAAEAALGRQNALLDQIRAQPAPDRLPPEPLSWLGANAALRYRELRAGAEL